MSSARRLRVSSRGEGKMLSACPRRSIRRGSNACGRSRRAKAVLAASLAAGATSPITSRCWHCTVALLLQQCYGSMTAELAMVAAPALRAGDEAGTIDAYGTAKNVALRVVSARQQRLGHGAAAGARHGLIAAALFVSAACTWRSAPMIPWECSLMQTFF